MYLSLIWYLQENNFASDILRLDKICLYWRVGCAPNVRFKMYIPLILLTRQMIMTLLWHCFLMPSVLCILTCIRTCCSNCVYLFPPAPPSYAEVVTEEQRRSNLAPGSACDDFERALQGPLFAYIQEFRFLPPPLYSEVSITPSSTKRADS